MRKIDIYGALHGSLDLVQACKLDFFDYENVAQGPELNEELEVIEALLKQALERAAKMELPLTNNIQDEWTSGEGSHLDH